MNKCEWEDGVFSPCDNFEPETNYDSDYVYCLYCDTDIRKPDPEEELICPWCNGSGEGQNDGTTCTHCKGLGVVN